MCVQEYYDLLMDICYAADFLFMMEVNSSFYMFIHTLHANENLSGGMNCVKHKNTNPNQISNIIPIQRALIHANVSGCHFHVNGVSH